MATERTKRTKSAYQLFCEEHRHDVASYLYEWHAPDKLPRGAIMKELGEMWKKISEEEKKPYKKEAAKLKAKAKLKLFKDELTDNEESN